MNDLFLLCYRFISMTRPHFRNRFCVHKVVE